MLKLSILGCRGIPAKYGGFETFAQRLALYLKSCDWEVTVYCEYNDGETLKEEYWQGIRLVQIPVKGYSALASIIFDWKSTLHAAKEESLILVLGYNTAIFSLWYRLKGKINIVNMDGMEWHRQKWKLPEKIWLYLNDWCGCLLGNHLIADHPQMEKYLIAKGTPPHKVSLIPYCSEPITTTDIKCLEKYDLVANQYVIVIARTEPENNLLEIVSAFSQKKRGLKLVILGRYLPEKFPYHQKVIDEASEEVKFIGTVYDKLIVDTLRLYARLYIHGHSVGGTNPSLIEALAAKCPILAHDNRFNRWVAGEGAHYFYDQFECASKFDHILDNEMELVRMKEHSWRRYQEDFCEQRDLMAYRDLLCELPTLA